jgi:beta-glucosidase
VATAKHYAANYQDYDRHTVSSDMDLRTLHEIYLPAFKACVEKGKVGAVMTSYNLINGVHASEHEYLINQVLKNDWGFKGIVMSDWTSTYHGVECARNGLDLEMPAGTFMHYDTLAPAIEAGELSEDIIDEKIRRILGLYQRFGYFDNPDISKEFSLDEDSVRSIAFNAARGGITLLKNENNILPLDPQKPLKIAVIGVNGHPAVTGGGGSSYVQPKYPVSLVEALRQVGGGNVEIRYEQALYVESSIPQDFFRNSEFYTFIDGKKSEGVTARFYGNMNLEGEPVYTASYSHLDLTLDNTVLPGVPEVNYSARFEGFFKVKASGNYRIAVAGDDGYRVYLDGKEIIGHWQNQSETLRSSDAYLTKDKEYKVMVEYFQAGGSASIRLGYSPEIDKKSKIKTLWDNAIFAAQSSDVVIFSAGFNNNIETEGMDRIWELPYGQDEMIMQLAGLNKNCIVVLNAGGNVSMPWLDEISGLIHAWYPGQEGNMAVAEIIFGLTNPSGKLPVSFEQKQEDNPTFNSYWDQDGDKKVFFSEGIFLGYRHFDRSETKPRFPFGFGLSYTTFDYSDIKIDKKQCKSGDVLSVSFKIKNSGDRDGAETAQLYVADKVSALPRPVKELKGFEKVFLKKGEEKTVTIILDKSAFSYYNEKEGGWISEPGEFEILVGSSSADLLLNAVVELVK